MQESASEGVKTILIAAAISCLEQNPKAAAKR